LRGTYDASKQYIKHLFVEGIKRRNLAMLDGALQASFPSYSTLSLLGLLGLAIQLPLDYFIESISLSPVIGAWVATVVTLLIYPLFGLALEGAPLRAYIAILLGPYFILWRSWLAVISRFGVKQVTWIRTEHGELD
jgi:hypothetical protein